MKSLSYKFNGGRSGHVFLFIFTIFIIAEYLQIKIFWDKSWNNQKIISEKSLKNYIDVIEHTSIDVIENKYDEFKSITFENFKVLCEKIKKSEKDFIYLKKYCIHPHNLINWQNEKYINNNFFYKIRNKLRELYYFDNKNELIDCITIHIRYGDLKKNFIKKGFDFNYYKNIIEIIRKQTDKQINIIKEPDGEKIFDKLKEIKNLSIYSTNIKDDFNLLCNSKILIISPSSFAYFAGLINKHMVLYDENIVNCRPNMFSNNLNNIFIKYKLHNFENILKKI